MRQERGMETADLPEPHIAALDRLVEEGCYSSRGRAITVAVNIFINRHVIYGHIKRPKVKKNPADENQYNVSIGSLFK
ncbi:MAG: ribbon-helix-helix domain-containing protein [Candidatus Aenigmatarchaeota archaeon]